MYNVGPLCRSDFSKCFAKSSTWSCTTMAACSQRRSVWTNSTISTHLLLFVPCKCLHDRCKLAKRCLHAEDKSAQVGENWAENVWMWAMHTRRGNCNYSRLGRMAVERSTVGFLVLWVGRTEQIDHRKNGLARWQIIQCRASLQEFNYTAIAHENVRDS